jgi:DNA-binding beta-propeller fold protein YncE
VKAFIHLPLAGGAALALSLLLPTPSAQALIAGDLVYVADVNSGAIRRFNSAGQGTAFGSVGAVNPVDLALDAAGNLYVANRSGGVTGSIDRFDPAGHRSLFTSAVYFPSGMAFDATGNLYAAMVGDNSIRRFDRSAQGSVFANSGLHGPLSLAFDASGNLYAGNQDDSTIMRFNAAGQPTLFAYSGLYPDGMAFDSHGNLFVANFGDNTIQRIDPTGHSTIFASGLNAPVDVALDRSDNLFVLDLGDNTILKFDPLGHSSVFAATGLGHAQSLVIFSVPEPASWALWLLGAAAWRVSAGRKT